MMCFYFIFDCKKLSLKFLSYCTLVVNSYNFASVMVQVVISCWLIFIASSPKVNKWIRFLHMYLAPPFKCINLVCSNNTNDIGNGTFRCILIFKSES